MGKPWIVGVALLAGCLPSWHSLEGKSCATDVDCGEGLVCGLGVCAVSGDEDTELLAHWRLDATSGTIALDSTARSHHGILVDGAVFTASTPLNGLVLDGHDDAIRIDGMTLTDSFTLSLWANIDSGRTDIQTFMTNRAIAGSFEPGFHFFVNAFGTTDRALYFESSNGTLGATLRSDPAVLAYPGWHHVVAAIDRVAGVGTFYLDGAALVMTGGVRSDFEIDGSLYIGRTGDAFPLGGKIDDVRVYDRVLSQAAVAALAAAGR